MSKQPDFLPEDTQPIRKPKDDYYAHYVTRRRQRGWFAVLALIAGVALGVTGAAALLIYQPRAVESILDVQLLSGTERALAQTVQAIEAQSTQSAIDLLGTQNALAAREAGLNAVATQNAFSLLTTQNAIILENAQRATQAAFYLQSTQAAIYLFATQIQAESAQQQLQIQLNQTATQLAVNAAATQGQLGIEFASTQAAQGQIASATAAASSP